MEPTSLLYANPDYEQRKQIFVPPSLEHVEEELKLYLLRQIGPICEEWDQMNPYTNYDSYPFWFQTKLLTQISFRSSLSNSKICSSHVPDIEFLTSLDKLNLTPEVFLGLSSREEPKKEEKPLQRCDIKVNLSNWEFLSEVKQQRFTQEGKPLRASENKREGARELVWRVLNAIMKAGQQNGLRFHVTEVDLAHTISATRSIFYGNDGSGKPMKREEEIEVLDLSYSQTSPRSLANLSRAIQLRVLILDHCDRLRGDKTSAHSRVFSILAEHKLPSLEVLSVVGTSNLLSDSWIGQVEQGCPKLHTLYFTRSPGKKAIGWDDLIMMQAMRDPQLLPCGHIADLETLKGMPFKGCSLDRIPFTMNSLVRFIPHITRLKKKEDVGWAADIVDHSREVLDDKVVYHTPCGEFYNISTLESNYSVGGSTQGISNNTPSQLQSKICLCCSQPFNKDLRICYAVSAKVDSDVKQFESLSQMNFYLDDM